MKMQRVIYSIKDLCASFILVELIFINSTELFVALQICFAISCKLSATICNMTYVN